jgi:hypothetical protein
MGARFRIGVTSPAQPGVVPGDIPRYDSVTSTYTVAFPTGSGTDFKGDPFNVALTYAGGGHEVKFGYQLKSIEVASNTYTFSNYPAGFLEIYRNGVPSAIQIYNTPVNTISFRWIKRYMSRTNGMCFAS